jgi:hypothetical protein
MRLPVTAALIAVTLLASCGTIRESRLNPMNWFGKSREVEQTAVLTEAPQDPRTLVQTVLSMAVEPFPGGAIIRATGLPGRSERRAGAGFPGLLPGDTEAGREPAIA